MSRAHRLLFSLSCATLAACQTGVEVAEVPAVQITPDRVRFGALEIGDRSERIVEVRNTGEGQLIVAGLSLAPAGELELSWYTAARPEPRPADAAGTLRVAPGEALFLVVTYTPRDDGADEGLITFATNAPEHRNVTVPVTAGSGPPEIAVSPQTVDFGRIAAGETGRQRVTVTNAGLRPLHLTRVGLDGSTDFSVHLAGRDPRRAPEALADPDGDGEPGLAPGAHVELELRYAPRVEGPDSGSLLLYSDDPGRPMVEVTLVANGDTPCLEVTPRAIEMPTSLVHRVDSRPFDIESCGSATLEIHGIRLSDDSDPAFTLAADSLPGLPALLPAAEEGAPRPSRGIRVDFEPRDARVHQGTVLIESNDPLAPVREVRLLGRGVLNACPQARVTHDYYSVRPDDVVVLDGSPSVDPDGPDNRPVAYEWVVTGRPEGSVAQPLEAVGGGGVGPPDDPSTPTAAFRVDLAGTYTVELRVTDRLGLDSRACDTAAVVVIDAEAEAGIQVQLTWTTGDGAETAEQGADVDLHLLHPAGERWFEAPLDCFYANPQPDWGQLGNPADDPVIDRDAVDGRGPENLSLALPENTELLGRPYLVGVHYYNAYDRQTNEPFGAATARVRIFLDGVLAWDAGERLLEAEDHFWRVAEVHWPAREVVARDEYETQRPAER